LCQFSATRHASYLPLLFARSNSANFLSQVDLVDYPNKLPRGGALLSGNTLNSFASAKLATESRVLLRYQLIEERLLGPLALIANSTGFRTGIPCHNDAEHDSLPCDSKVEIESSEK
jgi:hypothetical protein